MFKSTPNRRKKSKITNIDMQQPACRYVSWRPNERGVRLHFGHLVSHPRNATSRLRQSRKPLFQPMFRRLHDCSVRVCGRQGQTRHGLGINSIGSRANTPRYDAVAAALTLAEPNRRRINSSTPPKRS